MSQDNFHNWGSFFWYFVGVALSALVLKYTDLPPDAIITLALVGMLVGSIGFIIMMVHDPSSQDLNR